MNTGSFVGWRIPTRRLRSLAGSVSLACAAALLPAADASGGPAGELDGTFGANGRLMLADGGGEAILQQPSDGKLLVGGARSGTSTGGDFAVMRLHLDGSLDAGFGNRGIVTLDFGGDNDGLAALTVQPDGRILAAGTTRPVLSGRLRQFALARLNPDGTLDGSFGDDGRVTLTLGGLHDYLADIALEEDGRIVLLGATSIESGGLDAVFMRLHPNGALDTTFGTGPIAGATVVGSADSDEPAALIRQRDGKYLACGLRRIDELTYVGRMQAIRVNPDGSLDAGFGLGGVWELETDGAGGDAPFSGAAACVEEPDASLVLAGFGFRGPGESAVALARLRPDGVLDTGHWDGGTAFLELAGFDTAVANAILRLDDGGLAVTGVGTRRVDGMLRASDTFIARVDALTGSLDAGFGHRGLTVVDFDEGEMNADSWGVALIQQADGKLVSVGTAWLHHGLGGEPVITSARVDPRGAGHGGFVGFGDGSLGAREADGEVTIAVRRTGGGTGAVSVDYDTEQGSARPVADYTTAAGTLAWLDGDLEPKLITVALVNDTVGEHLETFRVILSNASAGLAQSAAQVAIWDDDGPVPEPQPHVPLEPLVPQDSAPSGGAAQGAGGGALGIEVLLLAVGGLMFRAQGAGRALSLRRCRALRARHEA